MLRQKSKQIPSTAEKQVTIHTQETCSFPAQRRISSYCANKEEKAHSIHSQKQVKLQSIPPKQAVTMQMQNKNIAFNHNINIY